MLLRHELEEDFAGHFDVVLRDVQGTHHEDLVEALTYQLLHQLLRQAVVPDGGGGGGSGGRGDGGGGNGGDSSDCGGSGGAVGYRHSPG